MWPGTRHTLRYTLPVTFLFSKGPTSEKSMCLWTPQRILCSLLIQCLLKRHQPEAELLLLDQRQQQKNIKKPSLFLKKKSLYCSCTGVLPASMSFYEVHAWFLQRPVQGIRSPQIGAWMIVTCHVDAKNPTHVLYKKAWSVCNHEGISLAPKNPFYLYVVCLKFTV